MGALAYDVLCGHAPFAPHEDISRDEEKVAILHKVWPSATCQLLSLDTCSSCTRCSMLMAVSWLVVKFLDMGVAGTLPGLLQDVVDAHVCALV